MKKYTNKKRKNKLTKKKGGWTVTSKFGIGGPLHQFVTIYVFLKSQVEYKTFSNYDIEIEDIIVSGQNTQSIFLNNIDYFKKLSSFEYYKKISENMSHEQFNWKDILENLVIGVILPDASLEIATVCSCNNSNFNFQEYNEKIIDEQIKNIVPNYNVLNAIKNIFTGNKTIEESQSKLDKESHNGCLSLYHFMISENMLKEYRNNSYDTVFNKHIYQILDCMMKRIRFSKYLFNINKKICMRYVGHIIHTYQDSFAIKHCKRNTNTFNITKLYCFTHRKNKNYSNIIPTNNFDAIAHVNGDIPSNILTQELFKVYKIFANENSIIISSVNPIQMGYIIDSCSLFLFIIMKYINSENNNYLVENMENDIYKFIMNFLVSPNLNNESYLHKIENYKRNSIFFRDTTQNNIYSKDSEK